MKFSIYTFLLFLHVNLLAQESSFQITLDTLIFWQGNLLLREDDSMVFSCLEATPLISENWYIFSEIPKTNMEVSVKKIRFKPLGCGMRFIFNSNFVENQLVSFGYASIWGMPTTPNQCMEGGVMISYNATNEIAWMKNKQYYTNSQGNFSIDNNQNVISIHETQNQGSANGYPYSSNTIIELVKMDLSGNVFFQKALDFINSDGRVSAEKLKILPNGNYILTGFIKKNSEALPYLIVLNEFGILQNSMLLPPNYLIFNVNLNLDISFDFILDEEGNIFWYGKTDKQYAFTDNEDNALIIKMDSNFNIIWSKVYHAENFEFNALTMNSLPNGNLVMAYSTTGAFPVILAELSPDGAIISEKGYPFFEPEIDVTSDGSLIMSTQYHFDETGNYFPQIIIAKTDVNGDLNGCETFPACLEATDITVPFSTMTVDTLAVTTDFTHIDLDVVDTTFTFKEICDIPQPPNPFFAVLDTLCINESIATTDTYNHFAHGIEWQLIGLNTDTIVRDSLNFAYHFTEAGEYQLTQTTWFLGCDESFTKTITVLEDLAVNILATDTICETTTILKINSNRPLQSVEWDNYLLTPEYLIDESGTYTLIANDGYCSIATDTAKVYFIKDLIQNPDEVINLPNEVVICFDSLPYELIPTSQFSTNFSLNGIQNGTSFLIDKMASYTITTQVENCQYEQIFSLIIDDCLVTPYFPNIFSPNNDGINDLFFAQGDDFAPISLTIYNRWGGQIYNGKTGIWNGQGTTKDAEMGVYVYYFTFQNLLTGKIKSQSGSVQLIR